MKRFAEFTADYGGGNSSLTESWVSKGYSVAQGARHASIKQSISTLLTGINSICEAGKRKKDIAVKLDSLFEVLQDFTLVVKGLTELSSHNINVSIASSLLAEDLRNVIATELAKHLKGR